MKHAIIGSVGQPRDGCPKAKYVIYDLDEGTIELRRLDYDVPGAQEKSGGYGAGAEAGLPQPAWELQGVQLTFSGARTFLSTGMSALLLTGGRKRTGMSALRFGWT